MDDSAGPKDVFRGILLNKFKNKDIMKLAKRQKDDQGALAPANRGGLSPFNELNRIQNEINRIFSNPFDLLAPSTSLFEGWEPNIDVYEDKDNITVRAELPGMKQEDIEVSLQGDTLIISGERKQEEEHKEGQTYRAERFFGRFQRSLTLPQPVDASKIQASYKDGVLTITLPKSEEAKRKRIDVKTQ
jgi:HSP20 family protein